MSKRGKAFYRGNAKKGGYGGGKLQVGMRGVILTCAMSGRMLAQACREVRDALTEYAPPPVAPEITSTASGQETAASDTIQPPSTGEVVTDANDAESEKGNMDVDVDDELNFEDELKKELTELKSTSTKKGRQERQRFLSIPTGCRGVEFVRFNDVNASEMVHKLMSIAEETQQSPCKLVSKLLPVTHSCKSHIKDIERSAREMLSEIFIDEKAPATTYQIQFKTRNNDSIKKQDIYTCLNEIIHETPRAKKHTVDLKNPKHVIICEILKTVCCMSIVKDYTRFKMYNMSRIVGTHQTLNIGASEGGSFKRGDDGGAKCPITDDEILEKLKLRQKVRAGVCAHLLTYSKLALLLLLLLLLLLFLRKSVSVQCKKKRDYLNADKIQEQLLNKGITIFDKDKVWKYENIDGEELDNATTDTISPRTEGGGEAMDGLGGGGEVAGDNVEQEQKSPILFSNGDGTTESDNNIDDKTDDKTDDTTQVKMEVKTEMKTEDTKVNTANDDATNVVVVGATPPPTSMTSTPVININMNKSDMDTSKMESEVVANSETQRNKQSSVSTVSVSVATVEPLKSNTVVPSETETASVVVMTPTEQQQQQQQQLVATDSNPVKRQAEDCVVDASDLAKRPKLEGSQ